MLSNFLEWVEATSWEDGQSTGSAVWSGKREDTYAHGAIVGELQLRNIRRIDAVVLQFVDVYMVALAILLVLAAGHRSRHVAGERSRK